MDIREVEKLLSVSRANIRFYEKQGLINPQRKENNYRDYSNEDVLSLKKVIVLRKLGFPIKEITDMKNGDLSLSVAITDNIKRLEETIDELKGALEIVQQIEKEEVTFESLDQDTYWNKINAEEQNGKEFTEIWKDYLMFELDSFDFMWKWAFFHDFKASRQKHGVVIACGILLLICIVRGIGGKFIWHKSFWQVFLYPFAVAIVGTIIVLPLYILSKKVPKIASAIASIMFYIILIFFLLLFIIIVVGIINSVSIFFNYIS